MKILLNLETETYEKIKTEIKKIDKMKINKIRVGSRSTLIKYLIDKALESLDIEEYIISTKNCKNNQVRHRKFYNKKVKKYDI